MKSKIRMPWATRHWEPSSSSGRGGGLRLVQFVAASTPQWSIHSDIMWAILAWPSSVGWWSLKEGVSQREWRTTVAKRHPLMEDLDQQNEKKVRIGIEKVLTSSQVSQPVIFTKWMSASFFRLEWHVNHSTTNLAGILRTSVRPSCDTTPRNNAQYYALHSTTPNLPERRTVV